MNGIVLINKEKGKTSRDVVNLLSKKFNTRKVGHAGTLDPLATGLLIIGINNGTKILELLTMDEKEYIATVKIGIQTDTYDITGNIIEEKKDFSIDKEYLENTLKSFIGKYYQEVPKYSAVKINGKKLYEYARNGEEIELPKRFVEIKEIELLEFKEDEFKFKVLVSKGTYIRSLINDIGKKINIPCTMKELIRTKSGNFLLENSCLIDEVNENNLLKIEDALNYQRVYLDDFLLIKKVMNGNSIELDLNSQYISLFDNDKFLAIYKKELDTNKYKAFKVF